MEMVGNHCGDTTPLLLMHPVQKYNTLQRSCGCLSKCSVFRIE